MFKLHRRIKFKWPFVRDSHILLSAESLGNGSVVIRLPHNTCDGDIGLGSVETYVNGRSFTVASFSDRTVRKVSKSIHVFPSTFLRHCFVSPMSLS